MNAPVIKLGVPYFCYGRKFGGGFTPEQCAEIVLIAMLEIQPSMPEPVRLQYHAFRNKLKEQLIYEFENAVNCERTRIGKIIDEHWPQLAYEIKNRCFNHILNDGDIMAEELTMQSPNPVSALKSA